MIFWNPFIKTYLTIFLGPICITGMESLVSDQHSKITYGTVIGVNIIVIILITIFLRNWKGLDTDEVKVRIGMLYDGLRAESKTALMHTPIFLSRRMLFAVSIVFIKVTGLAIQANQFLAFIVIYFTIVNKPQTTYRLNIIEVLNEFGLASITGTLFLYSFYVESSEQRFKFGWLFVGMFSFYTMANISELIFTIVLTPLYEKIKKLKAKRKHRQAATQLVEKK